MTKLLEEELAQLLQSARQQVEVGALYKHYKKGDIYRVTDIVIQTVDTTQCVIYEAQYGKQLTFARPLVEWAEEVTLDGKTTTRFLKLDAKSQI